MIQSYFTVPKLQNYFKYFFGVFCNIYVREPQSHVPVTSSALHFPKSSPAHTSSQSPSPSLEFRSPAPTVSNQVTILKHTLSSYSPSGLPFTILGSLLILTCQYLPSSFLPILQCYSSNFPTLFPFDFGLLGSR